MNQIKSAAPYLLVCLAVFLFGGLFQPGEWYDSLRLAPWNPPKLAFPIAWTILYVCIAIAGWQIAQSDKRLLLKIWFAQLALNAIWSWLFFAQHWVLVSLVDLVALVLIVAYLIIRCWQEKLHSAALLLAPYLAWLLLATSLNAYILAYN